MKRQYGTGKRVWEWPKVNPILVSIIGGVLTAVVIAYWVILHLLIDTAKFRDGIVLAVRQASGYETRVRVSSLGVFPAPHIVLEGFSIENPADSVNNYFLTASSARFDLSITSLLKGDARPVALTLDDPDLELERYAGGHANWQPFLQNGTILGKLPLKKLTIARGTVTYTLGEQVDTYKNINFDGVLSGNSFRAEGGITALGQDGRFSLRGEDGHLKGPDDYAFDVVAEASFGDDHISYTGSIMADPKLGRRFNGHFNTRLTDAGQWLGQLIPSAGKISPFSSLPKEMPLDVDFKVTDQQGRGEMTLETLVIGRTQGSGKLIWDRNRDPLAVSGAFAFGTIDFDQLASGDAEASSLNSLLSLLLPNDVNGQFRLSAEKLVYHGATMAGLQIESSLASGEMVVNQGSAKMAGDTRIITAGILKTDPNGLINYDGTLEMLGADVVAFIGQFAPEEANIIPATAKQFRAKANLFLAPGQGTISEIRFQAGDFQFDGGISLSPGGKYDSDATIHFVHARLDPLTGFLDPVTRDSGKAVYEAYSRRMDWLSKVDKRYHLNLLFEDFTFGARKGVRTQLIGSVAKDRMQFETIDATIDDVRVQGNLDFDQKDGVPRIDTALRISRFDLTSILAEDIVAHPVARGNTGNVWSGKKMNFDYLRGYDGKIEVSIETAVHPDFTIDDLRVSAKSANGDWTVSQLTGRIWGGILNSSMRMQALTVPALSVSFTIQNVQAAKMFDSLAGFAALRGNTAMSGELQTSGVTPQDWIRNMTGAMAFRGDDFTIKGFDLANLIQAIPSVRLVADVVNTARLAALHGQSSFSLVEGSFYFDQGRLATKNITFRSRQAIGKFSGGIDLIHWMIDSAIDFKLITVAVSDFPTVRITFQDSMDQPVISLDTRSLEAFVARRKLQ